MNSYNIHGADGRIAFSVETMTEEEAIKKAQERGVTPSKVELTHVVLSPGRYMSLEAWLSG